MLSEGLNCKSKGHDQVLSKYQPLGVQETLNILTNGILINDGCNKSVHKSESCNKMNEHFSYNYNDMILPVKSANCCIQCFQVQDEGCSQHLRAPAPVICK